jgi:hypothetical protein
MLEMNEASCITSSAVQSTLFELQIVEGVLPKPTVNEWGEISPYDCTDILIKLLQICSREGKFTFYWSRPEFVCRGSTTFPITPKLVVAWP